MTAPLDNPQTNPPAPTGHAALEARTKAEVAKRASERKTAIKTFFVALAGGVVAIMLENYMTPPLTHYRQHYADWRIELITLAAAAVLGYMPLAAIGRRAKTSA